MHQSIKAVNHMNRVLLEPQDYMLAKRGKPEPTKTEEVEVQTVPVQFAEEDPDEANKMVLNSTELQQLVSLLKNHSGNLVSKGNEAKQKYQRNFQ